MSDTTVAPAGGAPASEVVIDQNPVNVPNPVGSQAPDKPVGDVKGSEHRPESRREAIQRAFERANNPPPKDNKREDKPPPKAADAKPGHNQPPEETKSEETKALDLKKRPTEQPREQHREQGRFARAPDQQQPDQQQPRKASPLPEGAPYRDPPQRMSEKAKVDWASTPETVRGDMHRLVTEAEGIHRQYRGSHDAFQPIAKFHQMAQAHGTTLEKALTNYVTMEQKLRSDVVGGLDVIVNNLNLRTPDGQKLTLRDVAYYILNQSPEQHKLVQQSNAQTAAAQQIGALHQEITDLKNHLQQMHNQQQFTHTRSAVDQFADAHPRFDELGDLIENELKFGFDLETAYQRAELLRPGTAAQTRSTPAQTRTADKSISGAPDVATSNVASKRAEKTVGRREAISNAIRRVGGGL